MSGIQPRTADLVEAGQLTGGAAWTVATYAPGEIRLENGDRSSGNSGQRALLHPMGLLMEPFLNMAGWLRFGLEPSLELGVILGFQEQGVELRVGLVDEHDGAPVSVALSMAATVRPTTDSVGFWGRAGLDLSRQFGAFAPLLNLGVSFGDEPHALGVEERYRYPCGSFGDLGCGEYAPPQNYHLYRLENRLVAALGFTVYLDEYPTGVSENALPNGSTTIQATTDPARCGTFLTAAIAGYWVPWAEGDVSIDCLGCTVPGESFSESWGLSPMISLGWFPPQ